MPSPSSPSWVNINIVSLLLLFLLVVVAPAFGQQQQQQRPRLKLASSSGRVLDSTGDGNAACRCSEEETFANVLRSGAFKSPGFPVQYCDLLNCKWSIQPADDSFVSATLDFFETEHKYDVLEVYQTRWNGSQLLKAKQASLSGSFEPSSMERHFFSSLGGGLLFRFVSDSSEHSHHGFQISFQRHNKDHLNAPCPPVFHTAQPAGAVSAQQQLPVLANNFRTDSSCIFVINSTDAVKLTVKRFTVSMLRMKVYETENFMMAANNPNGVELGKIQLVPPALPQSWTSRTQSMTVIIHSAHPFHRTFSQTLGADNLYDIQFESVKSVCTCFPTELVVSRAQPLQLQSPGYPLEYCDDHNCTTRISLEGPLRRSGNDRIGYSVEVLRIRFDFFRTEADLDFLSLRSLMKWDAAAAAAVAMGKSMGTDLLSLSGEGKALRFFTFDSAQFSLKFLTDHSIVDRGFNLSVEAYQKNEQCICPGSPLNVLEGYKHSERNQFDVYLCMSMDCFWQIRPPKQEGIHRMLFWLNHTMADPSEFIEACQGSFQERNPNCYRFDLTTSGINHLAEFQNILFIGLPSTGPLLPVTIWYHREWSTEDSQPASTELMMPGMTRHIDFGYEWREACLCGQPVLRASADQWLSLQSPDYPNSYCRNMNCQWRLEAPEGHRLLLNITEFSTEADQDFLTIFDGNDTTQRHMEMLSGLITFKSPVHSVSQQVMTLLFTSDSSIQLGGFVLWFRAEPNSELVRQLAASGGGFPRALLFTLFLLLAAGGLLFLIVRANPNAQRTLAECMPSMDAPGTFSGLWEGRVRFTRHRRQSSSGDDGTQSLLFSQQQQQNRAVAISTAEAATSSPTSPPPPNFSATNPFFSFREPQNFA